MTELEHKGIKIGLPTWLVGTPIEDKIRAGTYENKESEAAMKRIRPGMKVLEIGAGLGFVSSICARAAGAANVVSVEPNAKMVLVARDTLERNGFHDAQVIEAAVTGNADLRPTAPFRAGKLFWGGRLRAPDSSDAETTDVPLIRFGDLLEVCKPRLVTMDIEGGELALFDDPMPAYVRFVMLETHPSRYGDLGLARIFEGLARSGFVYDPVTSNGRTVGFRKISHADQQAKENAAPKGTALQ